jgi:hypothetical protein
LLLSCSIGLMSQSNAIIGKYEAEIAYRIATCGLSCKSGSEEANDGEDG